MKYTLNQTGQAAIADFLTSIKFERRPWEVFARAERLFNVNARLMEMHRHDEDMSPHVIGLDPSWFDTARTPATFAEVVAMLRTVRRVLECFPGIRAGAAIGGLDDLLARCPKE